MAKRIQNPELINRLFYGLPDDRICKVARKVTVVGDKGTKVVIKERLTTPIEDSELYRLLKYVELPEKEEPIFLYKPVEYEELGDLIKVVEHKEVVVTSSFYKNREVRQLLSNI